ncbi:hypothetical protein I7I50_02418 [Histoplasma capsulatum G186AR]|uniref:Secreted protein n=1 Tax=Ajellomyces capsulatus TaxID=5037 RepID=A0A8H8D6W7_AJECA|nr:hypothetical protein I7I52_00918 [Histoplasma capsulatum]QSS71552.1 hypothetical protein I7I50_02418 [Histoplasma capsulatum G186AR]
MGKEKQKRSCMGLFFVQLTFPLCVSSRRSEQFHFLWSRWHRISSRVSSPLDAGGGGAPVGQRYIIDLSILTILGTPLVFCQDCVVRIAKKK